MHTLFFDNQVIISYAEKVTPISGGYLITGANVSLEFERTPREYYRHGWQSWSLTTWHDPNFQIPIQKPNLLHPMQTDPLYVKHPSPNGSWLGAVRFEDNKMLLLGALGLNAHVALYGSELHGWLEAGKSGWFVGFGDEETVFTRYAELLGERLGQVPKRNGKGSPRVWCSWYSLYTGIHESLLHRIFDELGDLPFDVLQVDDGWQVSIGDWVANEKFPSGMGSLADKIKSTGRSAGLWLAPLIAVESSSIFQEQPDWFIKIPEGDFVSAGFNWGEPLYALDTTHPDVLDWLTTLIRQVRAWGYDYLKLDFLYAGALPGIRHKDIPREEAYREGLKVMREAMGSDAYFLTCGAPIIPSLGLCDAIRVGADVAGEWESYRDADLLYNPTTPGAKNAIRTTVNRLWLDPLIATDPDVAYFRSIHNSMTDEQKRMLKDLAVICDFKATSDLPQWLCDEEREELQAFLEISPEIQRIGRYQYTLDGRTVDFTPAMSLPAAPNGVSAVLRFLLGWAGNQGWVMKLFDKLRKRATENIISGE